MPKAKRNAGASLPKHAPKRTGRRGIKPLDSDEDLPKKPRQARLPQMDDPIIEELEASAEAYVAIRDERIALTPQEKKLKDDLLAAMKRHGKEKYVRDGIEIKIVHESETVKVKIKKTEE
jgi:hypothetical protein